MWPIAVQSCLVLLEKESVVLEEDTKPDYEQENMSVPVDHEKLAQQLKIQEQELQIQEQELQIQELQLRIQEQQVQIQEQQQQIQEQQQHIQELIQELQEQQIQELDDEKVEGEYYHFIDRNFYRIKELKISGLAKKAGVGENLIIEEVDYYMKDKWNSFSPDLQAFLQEESNSEVPAYNEDQFYQIVNFIHITRDIYTAEMTEKISYLGSQLHTTIPDLEDVANLIRGANITAVDVVNFGIQDHNRSGRKNMLLQAFVALVDNGRYLYAPTGSHKSLAVNLSLSPIMPLVVVGEGSAALEEDTIPEQENISVPVEQQLQIEEQQDIPELIQELHTQELDDENVEGEYYESIDSNFYRMKELKFSGLAKKAGVHDENFFINEVELYMKDKWNSFSPDLQAFLQEESNSKLPASQVSNPFL
ncbi:hypothetical protein Tco_1243848 [Tanacetum coccineum]